MKTYRIENNYVGFLNGDDRYTSYMGAMVELIDFAKDSDLSKDYPKSKWIINEELPNGSSKQVYSVSNDKFNS